MKTEIFRLAITVGCVGIGCADERHFIMTEETLVEPNGDHPLGDGCTTVTNGTRGGTGGGSAAFDASTLKYGVNFEGLDTGVRVVVVGGENTIERVYDEAWLRGEKPADTVEVQIDADHRYRVRLWGGTVCARPDAS